MQIHLSREEDMIIKGTVIGNPYFQKYYEEIQSRLLTNTYVREKTFFLMELSRDITATFKKLDSILLGQGKTVVVIGTGGCYVRKNDQIEIKGQIGKAVLDDRERGESIFIQTKKMYNETLKFSLDY